MFEMFRNNYNGNVVVGDVGGKVADLC